MIFLENAYRLGFGQNVHGIMDNDKIRLYYKAKDGGVKQKNIYIYSGEYNASKTDTEISASEVVPIENNVLIARSENNAIKMIR